MPDWTSAVQGVAAYLDGQPRHGGKVGVLGISLGAQIASAASVGRADIDALVQIDGGFPNGYSQPVRSLPPLHLIWGSTDRTLPIKTGLLCYTSRAQNGHLQIIRKLVAAGAEVNAIDRYGNGPLWTASRQASLAIATEPVFEIVELLLRSGMPGATSRDHRAPGKKLSDWRLG
ncbi:hypothetical protein [Phyllobacterium zundukense]|uniref:hypothetical protein n=1 Tax=Phyllobacterium zundukense TaxID=1867719 RepID=UPI001F2EEFA0|nr:hypothetical protein [Phyllobacterium zundukense]